jgi:uncharacterized protein YjiS (DUF1127 family)
LLNDNIGNIRWNDFDQRRMGQPRRDARAGSPQEPNMPAALSPVSVALARLTALSGETLRRAARFLRMIENRRSVARLSAFEPRELADIGLTRSDVANALDQPLLFDPSEHLARAAHERRLSARALRSEASKAWPAR